MLPCEAGKDNMKWKKNIVRIFIIAVLGSDQQWSYGIACGGCECKEQEKQSNGVSIEITGVKKALLPG
jgi:hypothetical protein